jgi:hypothetical protein
MFCLLQKSIFLVPESVFKVWKTDLRKVKGGRRVIPEGNVLTAGVECCVQHRHKGSSNTSDLALATVTFQRTHFKTKTEIVTLLYISLCNEPSAGTETQPQHKDWGCDMVLPAQDAVTDEHEAMAEWWSAGEVRRNLKKTVLSCHFVRHESQTKSLGIQHGAQLCETRA